ncbi:MAG: pyrroline-5-carboxylate reductase [Lachnospiraceae bacterium]|nr:pyrroline-5-carboxylate reductase [Lachnospiraceae bacterium]
MKKYKIGFVGAGNMGSAMIGGIVNKGLFDKSRIIAADMLEESRSKVKAAYGIDVTDDNKKLAAESEVVLIAVKPYQFDDVLADLREGIDADTIVISVAAGKTISIIENALMSVSVVGKLRVVRAMPNTPALVGEAMTGLAAGSNVTDEDMKLVLPIFESFGKAEVISENQMDIITGLSGSSPAYVYMMIEAMADAAVEMGFNRQLAYDFASQAVLGAAKMVRDTKKHPGELKDAVCSPGGTTIAGVAALEKGGFRSTVSDSIKAAIEKAR